MKQIIRARGLPPDVPGTGMAGEKTKDDITGAIVLLIKLAIPKVKPNTAPIFGPSISEPIITGT